MAGVVHVGKWKWMGAPVKHFIFDFYKGLWLPEKKEKRSWLNLPPAVSSVYEVPTCLPLENKYPHNTSCTVVVSSQHFLSASTQPLYPPLARGTTKDRRRKKLIAVLVVSSCLFELFPFSRLNNEQQCTVFFFVLLHSHRPFLVVGKLPDIPSPTSWH